MSGNHTGTTSSAYNITRQRPLAILKVEDKPGMWRRYTVRSHRRLGYCWRHARRGR